MRRFVFILSLMLMVVCAKAQEVGDINSPIASLKLTKIESVELDQNNSIVSQREYDHTTFWDIPFAKVELYTNGDVKFRDRNEIVIYTGKYELNNVSKKIELKEVEFPKQMTYEWIGYPNCLKVITGQEYHQIPNGSYYFHFYFTKE